MHFKRKQNEINNFNPRRELGTGKITSKMIKELPRKGIITIIFMFNAILSALLNSLNDYYYKRLCRADPNAEDWIPFHQIGFRVKHSTIPQTHIIIHVINQTLPFGTEGYFIT